MLDKWIKTARENITHPWSRGMIKGFVRVQDVFEKYRDQVFKTYEDAGGEYMGEEDIDDESTSVKKINPTNEFEEDFDGHMID